MGRVHSRPFMEVCRSAQTRSSLPVSWRAGRRSVIAVAHPRDFGLSPVQNGGRWFGGRGGWRWPAAARMLSAPSISHTDGRCLCEMEGAGRVAAEASPASPSRRKGLQAGARQRASTDYDPQPPPPSEAAGARREVDGGRPGGRRPPLFSVCVSTWSRRSATEPFDVQVHTTSTEGAHVSPPTQGTSSGTGWTNPSPLARSDARLLAEGALRGRVTASAGGAAIADVRARSAVSR